MLPGMDVALDQLPDDPVLLKAMIVEERARRVQMAATVKAYEVLVQALKVRIARLRRQKFGRSSEKIEREIEQLELALEALEVKIAADDTSPEADEAAGDGAQSTRPAPRRRGKPRISEDAPRERVVLDPGEVCPECGGELRVLGEDISEILEFVAARLKVVETVRLKKSCRRCEKIAQPAAPTRPIPRGMAGPGLLAHILVAKFDDHLPLYRQGEIFARLGADIPRSTLIDWSGQATRALRPLVEKIKQNVLSSNRLHAPIGECVHSLVGQGMTRRSVFSTRRSRRRARIAASRKVGSGPMCATTGHGAGTTRRGLPISSRLTARANTPRGILRTSGASCRPMPEPVLGLAEGKTRGPGSRRFISLGRMARFASARPHAGRICAGTFTTSGKRPVQNWPGMRSTGSARSTISSARSTACPPISAWRSAIARAAGASTPSMHG